MQNHADPAKRQTRCATPDNLPQLVAGAITRTHIPVLMYHSVPRKHDKPGCLPIPVEEFHRQVETLAEQGAQVVGLTEALSLKAKEPHRFIVAMTFDDGYADVVNAADVLQEFGGRGTAYVCPGLSGAGREPRSHRKDADLARRLSVEEMRELRERGLEIGSHSMTHRPMDVLTPDELWHEVHQSRIELEQSMGARVTSFCYPHGYSGPAARSAVAEAGYENACIVGRRIARRDDDPYAIPRIEIVSGEVDTLFLRRVLTGEPGIKPYLKRVATPIWHGVRLVTRRTTGRIMS